MSNGESTFAPKQAEVLTEIDIISGLVEQERSRRLHVKARDSLQYGGHEASSPHEWLKQCEGCYELRYPKCVYQVLYLKTSHGRDYYELVRLP